MKIIYINIISIIIVLLLVVVIISIIYYYYNSPSMKWNKNTELLIVSSHYNEDIEWLKDSIVPVIICSKVNANNECYVDQNKGREVSSYLKFIITFYNELPQHIAFIHGHEKSWHQHYSKNIIDIIINCAKFKEYDFISLNNNIIDDRTLENEIMKLIHNIWDDMFRPYLKRDPPIYIRNDCCAQFIVSREAIHSYSLDTYKFWYDKIMETQDDFIMGKVFEYLWSVIYGDPDILTNDEYMMRFKPDCFT